MNKIKKCLVMFSGGLDSRLALKIMQGQNFEIVALFFKLPFGTGCCDEKSVKDFLKPQKIKYKIFDCTKGVLLKEYLKVVKTATHGTGTGMNPCIDCRLFLLEKAKEFANKEKIDLIVTGEVLGERPMSQMKKKMDLIEKKSGLKGRLLRPLSAKFFPETNAEKRGFVNRENLYDIQGRRREKQIKLAKMFEINYPSPAGGCLLCEKNLKNRLRYLSDRGINEKEVKFVAVGKHFVINKCWVVIGRNEAENKLIEDLGQIYTLLKPTFPGPSAVIFDDCDRKTISKVGKIILAYSKKGSLKDRKRLESIRI